MLPLALTLGAGFLLAFLAAYNSGQFEDLETPAHRILKDDMTEKPKGAQR